LNDFKRLDLKARLNV